MSKLKVNIFDKYEHRTYCKIELNRVTGEQGEKSGANTSVYCCGEFEFDVQKGNYEIQISKGRMYWPSNHIIMVGDKDIELSAVLQEVLDIKAMGLYSFDAHSHVSRDENSEAGNLEVGSTVLKGEDFNFFFAGSPYDNEVHRQYLKKNFTDNAPYREKYKELIKQVNDESFILDIGNEIVKCRYGHAFMMNFVQKPPFSKYYDEEFDPWLFNKVGEEPPYSIAYMHEALLSEKGECSAAAAAHPTSWWWHDNGEFITNIAATLGFELLAGSIDAMVIMGYQSDQLYYQGLWFDALKNGYFLPGIAETDTFFDNGWKMEKTLMFKTYTLAEEFSLDSLSRAVKKGRNIVSSGPILMLKVDGKLPGEVIPHEENREYFIEITANRCCRADLSKIQLIINGEVYKEYDTDNSNINLMESMKLGEGSFVIAKCYDKEGNVAITNPVYIRNKPFANQNFYSKVNVIASKGGKSVRGQYWIEGEKEKHIFEDSFSVDVKVYQKIGIEVEGNIKIINLFELEELQQIFKNLYFGWFNKEKKYEPGQVPAEFFEISRIRKILENVNLEVRF